MDSQQILACCLLELCKQDDIKDPQFEDISDREAALILKLISEGNHHLDIRQAKSGENCGKLYPWPVANCNYIDHDSETYLELTAIWKAE
jgi:hypothetical protein